MIKHLDRYKSDLETLVELGRRMKLDLQLRSQEKEGPLSDDLKEASKSVYQTFEHEYQKWYTEACAVIKQLIPQRHSEFEYIYKGDGKRKIVYATSYNIQDWMLEFRSADKSGLGAGKYFDDLAAVTMRYIAQFQILSAVGARFESSLFDIRQVVQAELFDCEIDAGRELAKNGFFRAAGAMAGVVLEKHLAQVATNHHVTVRKQHPTINDLNDLLKNTDVIDVPTWRLIQRLGDLRNLCDHNKQRDPKKDEIDDLLDGVEKITKTVF